MAADGKPMRVVLLGAPGSGKGTQAAKLAEELGVPAISTGDMLRAAVAEGSELGTRVEEIINSGALVDDVTMARVVEHRLAQKDAEGGFLLDGYPRTLEQAGKLAEILESSSLELDVVIAIRVPEDELVRRAVARQREDDKEQVVRARLELYRGKTEPLTGFYEKRGLLVEIDGNQAIAEVTSTILAALAVEADSWS